MISSNPKKNMTSVSIYQSKIEALHLSWAPLFMSKKGLNPIETIRNDNG